ncbi:MAG: peptidase M13 [Actinomycetaceae bacterium]|nr:peptidase M13 [Arcanobacterium sp.]MDD7687562.1 peptidase M13 [Actinomycetaceae bacterium]MDY5273036.1 M13-type metalloendopeptidase [Arcanobacterium sp.]
MTTVDDTTLDVTGALNMDVRPQDDFYRFVNGTWIESADIPPDQSSTGSFVELRNTSERRVRAIIEKLAATTAHREHSGQTPAQEHNSSTPTALYGAAVTNQKIATDQEAAADEAEKIGALFNSFMDEQRIEELGTAPLQSDFDLIDAADSKAALATVAGRLNTTGVDTPFFVEIDADRNDPQRYICWIGQSGLGLPDEAYYRAPEHAETLTAYRSFIPKLYALARSADGRSIDSDQAQAAADAVIRVETALAAHHFTVIEERDAEKTNNVMQWDAFIASAPGFDWDGAFAALGLSAQNAPQLLVVTPRALTGFAAVWEHSSLDDLKEYLRWSVIRARAPFLTSAIVQTNFDFYGTVLSGQEELRDRWKRAVALVGSVLGEAVGKAYVTTYFPPEYKAQMEQLVADLLEAYRQSITALDWMSPDTKRRALEKLDAFTPKIAYPDKWRDYSSLTVDPHDLVGNVRAAHTFEHAREVAKLGTPVDRDEWFMTPQTVNAYYNPVMNEIVFPAAILQPPFFDPEADPAWNYGGIGAVIGHEIGHGFDDQGSKYDGAGRLNNWWTDADRREFEKRTAALVDQYDAYIPSQLGADSPHHVQGQLTLGENIGDLGGLTIALKAYDIAMRRAGYASSHEAPVLQGFTGIQRVLLSYARIWQEKARSERVIQLLATDPHSPDEFRCNGIVKNIDDFAEQFSLNPGDALYLPPEERVHIW